MSRTGVRPPAWAVAGAIAAVYLVWQPPSADLAAAVYRIGVFSAHGFVVYDPQWYGGYLPLGYSLLLGPLGSLLGARLLAAVSAVAAAAAFARLVEPAGHRLASVWFAVGVGVSLGSGRVAFTLGLALGVGAVLAARSREPAAIALAVATGLASPLAGAFLGLAAVAGAPDPAGRSWRRRGGLAAAGILPGAALAVAFPTPGHEPFAASAFWPALAVLGVLAGLAPVLRPGIAVYAAACVAAFAIPTAVGGNVVRLGALLAGPLAAVGLRERRAAVAVLAVPLAYWQLQAPIRDVLASQGDPSTGAAYYTPLERVVGTSRIEVPFTASHWEAALLAPRVAVARGWERQLDIAYNGLFYRPRLTSAAYADWLRSNGIAYVAVPDVALDYSARQEAGLIAAGQDYLRPVARLAHWRVYGVVGARPLASAPARLTGLGPDRFSLEFARPGTSVVRVRYTAYWRASGGCVEPGPGGFTAVRSSRPGGVVVVARVDFAGLLERGRACS